MKIFWNLCTCVKSFFHQLISLNYRKYKVISKKIKIYFMHSALLLLQHIQILMININFSISYGNICMCTKHFASHYTRYQEELTKKTNSSRTKISRTICINLKLVTLDALMCISCANILIESINWNGVLIVWKNMKDCKIHPPHY